MNGLSMTKIMDVDEVAQLCIFAAFPEQIDRAITLWGILIFF